jgi:hypothetical protein
MITPAQYCTSEFTREELGVENDKDGEDSDGEGEGGRVNFSTRLKMLRGDDVGRKRESCVNGSVGWVGVTHKVTSSGSWNTARTCGYLDR